MLAVIFIPKSTRIQSRSHSVHLDKKERIVYIVVSKILKDPPADSTIVNEANGMELFSLFF